MGLGVAEGGADLSGGSVMSGVSVGVAVDGAAVGVADGPGSAVTGVVYVNRPAARSVTPRAVRIAGRRRVRIRSDRSAMGREC